MNYETIESKFIATPEKGEVSSILMRPDNAEWPARSRTWGKHKHAQRQHSRPSQNG